MSGSRANERKRVLVSLVDVGLAGFFLTVGPAAAQNLIVDGEFAVGNLAAWTAKDGIYSWESFTESGAEGSVLLASDGAYVGQCVAAVEGADYFARASSFLPVQGDGYFVHASVAFYDSPGCLDLLEQHDAVNAIEGEWVALRLSITAPAGAESILFLVQQVNILSPGRVGFFDNAFLAPGLFVDGFENGSTRVWSDAVGN